MYIQPYIHLTHLLNTPYTPYTICPTYTLSLHDRYKSHLADSGGFSARTTDTGQEVQSARHNLASSFVNGFVNAGFCKDKLLLDEESDWVYQNKDDGKLSATASIGQVREAFILYHVYPLYTPSLPYVHLCTPVIHAYTPYIHP